MAQQANQLAFALGEGDPLGRQETVGQRLFKPEFAFIYALQTFNQQIGWQRFAKNSANADGQAGTQEVTGPDGVKRRVRIIVPPL